MSAGVVLVLRGERAWGWHARHNLRGLGCGVSFLVVLWLARHEEDHMDPISTADTLGGGVSVCELLAEFGGRRRRSRQFFCDNRQVH